MKARRNNLEYFIEDTPIIDWGFHKDRKCPQEYIYGSTYQSLEKAQIACETDSKCSFVYDGKCDSSGKINEIQLCKKFGRTELKNSPIDCVYEVKKQGN